MLESRWIGQTWRKVLADPGGKSACGRRWLLFAADKLQSKAETIATVEQIGQAIAKPTPGALANCGVRQKTYEIDALHGRGLRQ
jgi:hypothetical protein